MDEQQGLNNAHLLRANEDMLNGLGQLSDYFGFSKVMGQIYCTVLLSQDPLCLDDVVDRLDVSKATVSLNLRTLEHLGIVRQVYTSDRSDRRKFYEAETDFWQIITNVISGRELRDVERAITTMEQNVARLQEIMPTLTAEEHELAVHYIEKIDQIQAIFRFVKLLLTTILVQVGKSPNVGDISEIRLE